MALQSIKGGAWLPVRPPQLNAALSTVQLALGVTAYRAGFVIQAPRSGDITRIGFLCEATSPSNAIVEARMEWIDAATGFPTGSLLDSNAYGAVTLSAGTQWYTATLQSPLTVAQGAPFALVFRFTTGSLTSCNVIAVSSACCPQEFPYTVGNTGSWIKYQHAPICALEYSVTGYEVVQGAWPIKAIANTPFNSGTSPNQRALRVKLPFPAQAVGAWVWADLDGDADLKLFSAANPATAVASLSIDKDLRYGMTYGRQAYYFNTPVVLNQDAEYFLTLQPTSGASVILSEVEVNAAAVLDAMDGGRELYLATRSGTGAFTPATTKRPMMRLILDQFPGDLGYFDVTTFGAKGDGVANDTGDIQEAIDAAAGAGEGNTVFLPQGTYLCQGLNLNEPGLRFIGDGTLKLIGSSTAACVLEVSADYCQVTGIRIDGNGGASHSGAAHGLLVSASYCHILNVTAKNSKAVASTATFKFPVNHNLGEGCRSEDAGGDAFSDTGDYNRFQDISAKNWGNVAFHRTVSAAHKRLDIDGGYLEPGNASASKNCLLFDGSTGTTGMVVIRNTVVDWKYAITPSGTPSIAKFGRVDWLILDNCQIQHQKNMIDLEIGANVKRLHLDHTFLSRQLKLNSIDSDTVILLDDAQIGSDALWNGGSQPTCAVLGIGGSQYIARSSQFIGYTAAALEVVLNLQTSSSFVHFEASECTLYSYNTGVTTYDVTTFGSGAVNVSRKVLWLNNRRNNLGGSASQFTISDAEQQMLFTTRDWSKHVYEWHQKPTTSGITWSPGDVAFTTSPTAGTGKIGWVYVGSPTNDWKEFGPIS